MKRVRLAVVVSLLALGGIASAESREVVLSLTDLDCGECGGAAAEILEKKKGVESARFDMGTAELHIRADASIDEEQLMAWVRSDDVKPVVGAGKGNYLPFAEMPEGADVDVISKAGEDVPSLEAIAVKGKVTVIDFYAPWCEPCREVDAHVAKLLATRTDIAYRKINVVDWTTPVAKRHMKKVAGLPYLVVLGKDGKELGKVTGLNLKKLDKLIAKGAS
jgi:thiol-disulfide isomerase/thioredoxin